jgi:hypothetical protein
VPDVVAVDQPRLHRLPEAGAAQGLLGGLAVRGVARVGDRDAPDRGIRERAQLLQAAARARRDADAALRVERAGLAQQGAALDQVVDEGLVGREEHVGGGAHRDLLREVARRAHHERDLHAVGCLEPGRDVPEREGEIGRPEHGDGRDRRGEAGAVRGDEREQGDQRDLHRGLHDG